MVFGMNWPHLERVESFKSSVDFWREERGWLRDEVSRLMKREATILNELQKTVASGKRCPQKPSVSRVAAAFIGALLGFGTNHVYHTRSYVLPLLPLTKSVPRSVARTNTNFPNDHPTDCNYVQQAGRVLSMSLGKGWDCSLGAVGERWRSVVTCSTRRCTSRKIHVHLR